MKNLYWLGSAMILTATTAWPLGIRIADQDPLATARGNAFAATADNPSAIYYNPAGISQIEGHSFRAGVYGISLESTARNTASGTYSTIGDAAAVPQLYYSFTPAESRLSFGLGVYSPYGLSLEWPDGVPFRMSGVFGSIKYFSINPVVSWKITDSVFLAVGGTANYSEMDLKSGLAGVSMGDSLRFKGDGWTPGFNVGAMWKITEQHVVGVSYRSETRLKYEGTSTLTPGAIPMLPAASSSASTDFTFPQHVVVGYSFRPNEKWNFEINVDWADWSALKSITLNQPGITPIIGPVTVNLDWESSFFYEFGATRYFDNGYRISGGYIFSENSVPDSAFNPLVPDSDRHIFSVGVGRNYESGWNWDFAYQFAWGPERAVSNPNNPPANGTYEFFSHALTLAVGKRFR